MQGGRTVDDICLSCLFFKNRSGIKIPVHKFGLWIFASNQRPFLLIADESSELPIRMGFIETEEGISPDVSSSPGPSLVRMPLWNAQSRWLDGLFTHTKTL